jgi:predicted nucleotide-binding protein
MAASTPSPAASRTPRVAIVCRDDAAGEAVTTFIADLGLEPVISLEPRGGASLDVLEGLRQVDFAVVLQPDRLLEIGFLLAAVGRQRLRLLQAGGNSDALPGVSQQPMDEGGLWRLLLARDMRQAGLEVDLNKAM